MEKQYRYPGTRPFSENDRHLFFGRNNDIKQLSELIVLEKLVVLFSKSGYGKSSLLNAGVIPRLTEVENHKVLNVRLNEQDRNPVELLVHHLKSHETEKLWLSNKFNLVTELPDELAAKLWYYAKNIQLANEGCQSVTLVFDQFEELFNYSPAQVQEFGKTIATLLNLNMPEVVRLLMKQKMKTDADYFTDTETDQLLEPLNLKVVFSLRNDRLSLLNQLKTYLPAVFKKTYELQPLDEMQALEALLEPAMKEGNFASPAFSYTNAATELILNSLKDSEHQRIETFQLQLICQHAEELIIRKTKNLTGLQELSGLELSAEELGKPEDIFEKHYKIIIDSLPENHQYAARVLIEDKLIIGGNRVPLPETVITQQHNIAANLLKTLVDKRLLRSEPNTVGGTSYELSHDTLVAPITKAAEIRRQKEEEARAEAERQEEIRKLKEKQRKDRRRLMLVIGALIIALTLSGIAVWKWIDANAQKEIATAKTKEAEQSRHLSDSLYILSEKNNLLLEKQQEELKLALNDAKTAKDEAEQKRIEADLAKNISEQKTNEIAGLLAKFVPDSIKNVYQFALQQADFYMEWDAQPYNNIDAYAEAIKFLSLAKYAKDCPPNANIPAIDRQIKNLNSIKNNKLIAKANNLYYSQKYEEAKKQYEQILQLNPKSKTAILMKTFCLPTKEHFMVKVKAGKYKMSDDFTVNHTKDFYISAYETTNSQYARFLNEYGSTEIKKGDYAGKSMINLEGSYGLVKCRIKFENGIYTVEEGYECFPVVYVSWYGANEYCNFYELSLPTEAQWEYAAAGGQHVKTHGNASQYRYAGSDTINNVAWYKDNSGQREHFVGELQPNQLGLYDMSGNLWEWCFDWYTGYPKGEFDDYKNSEITSGRVGRGGGWDSYASGCRVAYRYNFYPYSRYINLGFRAVLAD